MNRFFLVLVLLVVMVSSVGCDEAYLAERPGMIGWSTVPGSPPGEVISVDGTFNERVLVLLKDDDGDVHIWVDNQYRDIAEGTKVLVTYDQGRYRIRDYVPGKTSPVEPVEPVEPESDSSSYETPTW